MGLLPAAAFSAVFEPLRGRHVGYVRLPGNAGDALLERAAFQLLAAFGVHARLVDPAGARPAGIDAVAVAGGGSMGSFYGAARARREAAVAWGLPVTVLPQSFVGPESVPYDQVFAREPDSLRFRPDAELAPDLALGLDVPAPSDPPDLGEGVWLRADAEGRFAGAASRGDPAACGDPDAYLRLAGRHARVVTDRLHFAVAALACGRRATLLPNRYHKNRAVYDAWLRGLGCDWADAPPGWAGGPGRVLAAAEVRGPGGVRCRVRMRMADEGPARAWFAAAAGVRPGWVRAGPVVVDVGAGVGAFALAAAVRHAAAAVHAFDPDLEAAALFRDNLAGVAGVVLHPVALGCGDAAGGPRDAGGAWDALGLGDVDLLKVNAGGREADVLRSLGGRLARVRVVLAAARTAAHRAGLAALLPTHRPVAAAEPAAGVVAFVREDLARV